VVLAFSYGFCSFRWLTGQADLFFNQLRGVLFLGSNWLLGFLFLRRDRKIWTHSSPASHLAPFIFPPLSSFLPELGQAYCYRSPFGHLSGRLLRLHMSLILRYSSGVFQGNPTKRVGPEVKSFPVCFGFSPLMLSLFAPLITYKSFLTWKREVPVCLDIGLVWPQAHFTEERPQFWLLFATREPACNLNARRSSGYDCTLSCLFFIPIHHDFN